MYREVTGNMVVDGGVSAFRIAEVRALFPERYNDAGRKSKEFANVADTLLGVTSAGAKIDTLTVASQANLVCTALFKNSLGAAWVSMPRENEHVGEIFRRVGPRDELFSHVFCVSWRRVLPSVSAALPKTIEGAAAMAMVARFATARLRSSGVTVVTESLASTVESSVGLLLNRLDTATLRDADNETRAKEVERVLASGEYTPGTGASRGAKGQRDDDFNQLYAQQDFKKLLQKLEKEAELDEAARKKVEKWPTLARIKRLALSRGKEKQHGEEIPVLNDFILTAADDERPTTRIDEDWLRRELEKALTAARIEV